MHQSGRKQTVAQFASCLIVRNWNFFQYVLHSKALANQGLIVHIFVGLFSYILSQTNRHIYLAGAKSNRTRPGIHFKKSLHHWQTDDIIVMRDRWQSSLYELRYLYGTEVSYMTIYECVSLFIALASLAVAIAGLIQKKWFICRRIL